MESTVRTFAIPNELCRRAGIAATWHSINNLGIFPSQSVNPSIPDRPSPYGPSEASVFNVRQDILLFEPILRKLVNESNGIFLNLQILTSGNVANLKQELLKVSHQYRSVIRACLENLQDEVARVDEHTSENMKNYITIFYSIECIWHLCEILFIENIPGSIVLPHLLEWVRFHFPKYERQATIYLNSDIDNIELDPDYWKTVIGCLLQGRVEVVRALLTLHSSANSPVFKLFDQTLKSMPIYNVYSGTSVTEFNLRWKHWLVDTQSKIDAKSFVSESHLNLMMKLAVGEELAWNQVQAQCEAWYELLASWLFFTEPTVKTFELGQFARRCIGRMGVRDHLRHLDQILLAALEADIFQVIKEIQHMSENGWFVSHLTDLLFHAGVLDTLDGTNEDLVAGRLRESFLIDYGVLMSSHHSLWQLGLSYLDHCPSDGLHVIQLLLQKLPLGTEVRVQKIVREALKRDLHPVGMLKKTIKFKGIVCKYVCNTSYKYETSVPVEKVYEEAVEMLQKERQKKSQLSEEEGEAISLTKSFKDAQEQRNSQEPMLNIKVNELFKE
ncbi:nuclear pore complex protein Nup85-like [Agrilus planipennis]|uniref:Nuclear pore complex protein Nup85 n=1 Tax=Agrilus planipennis TaxID=224129 RepID=A0A7F5RM12_AGRPL|nr:nuclear pore complex protein Nup85-like [Agrilus planipennis]